MLFRDLLEEAHNLAHYQQLKFLILKLGLRYVGLPHKSSASDCRDLLGKEKLKASNEITCCFLHLCIHLELQDLCLNSENKPVY